MADGQMELVGTLPDSGNTLYYAEPSRFVNPGYYVWDAAALLHRPVEVVPIESEDSNG